MELSSLINLASIGCACTGCTKLLWINNFSLKDIELATLVIHAQSAAMLPIAVVLLLASVKPGITEQIHGMNTYYLISSISLGYVSIISLQF